MKLYADRMPLHTMQKKNKQALPGSASGKAEKNSP